MKFFYQLLLIFLALFYGCSSKHDLGEGASSISDSALESNNLQDAPSWVLNGGRTGFSAVGSAEIGSAGFQFARNEALAVARDELARIITTSIDGSVTVDKSVTGSSVSGASGQNYDTSNDFNYSSKQSTNQLVSQIVSGSKQKDMWITTDGKEVYVLVEIDASVANKIRSAPPKVQTSNEDSSLER